MLEGDRINVVTCPCARATLVIGAGSPVLPRRAASVDVLSLVGYLVLPDDLVVSWRQH